MPSYHLHTANDAEEIYTGKHVELIVAQGASTETAHFITKASSSQTPPDAAQTLPHNISTNMSPPAAPLPNSGHSTLFSYNDVNWRRIRPDSELLWWR
jgi:hypothetical protein